MTTSITGNGTSSFGGEVTGTGFTGTLDGVLGGGTAAAATFLNYTESVVAVGNSGTAKTLSLAKGTVQTVTMTGNCTFTMPATTAGMSFTLIADTGDGDFTGAFTSVKWPANTAPTLTTTASRWDILAFISDGSYWYGSYIQAFA